MNIPAISKTPGKRHQWTRGDRLRKARENTPGSPSQAEFAPMIGFSKNTVARYERDEPGANKPIVFIRWAEITGYDLEWLWTGDENGPDDSGHPMLGVQASGWKLRVAA